MNLKNLDSKLIKRLGILLIIMITILLIMFIIILASNKKLKYSDLESVMINSAKNYYKNNPDELPQNESGYVIIDSDKLIEEKYMKPFNKYLKKENTCSGQVKVSKNVDYLYSVTLDCGEEYKTKKFNEVLKENIVTTGNGLYEYNGRYIFRGDNVNNYVIFADKTWLIVGINTDGTIRLIDISKKNHTVWDDRYNSEKEFNFGINDYTVSRIKDDLKEQYEALSNSNKSYLTDFDLCIDKINKDELNNNDAIECSNKLENQYVGLLYPNEFALASLDKACIIPTKRECTNYNYFETIPSFWTVTGDSVKTYLVYKIANVAVLSNASSYSQANMVVHINNDVNYVSGDGSKKNPYIFQ